MDQQLSKLQDEIQCYTLSDTEMKALFKSYELENESLVREVTELRKMVKDYKLE